MKPARLSRVPRVVALVLAVLAGLVVTLTASPASAATATHLVVVAPANATAGTSVNVVVTAEDGGGVTDPTATQVVHFTSSDPQAILPADIALVAGEVTVGVVFQTAGNQTVTATDTSAVPLTPGTSDPVAVAPSDATHFVVSAPTSATTGVATNVTVTAKDQYGNTATGYAGTVHLTSSDVGATLPPDTTLTSGAKVFSVMFATAGTQTVTATDTVTSSITGISGPVAVSGPATHFAVSAAGTANVGSPVSVSVTAKDASGNTATGYAGTVAITTTGGGATLPPHAMLTNGVGTFSVTFTTTGAKTVTATDTVTPSITGTSGTINVSASATHFVVTAPATATSGSPISVTVKAKDGSGKTITTYSGTVHITSSDAAAVLPANASLTNGVGTFSVTLKTAGSQTVTATDTANSSITGTSTAIRVSGGAHLAVTAPSTAASGTPVSVTVTAKDSSNATLTTYTGTVHFTSTDTAAVLPANGKLTNGVGTFMVTFKTAGTQTITATDTVTSSITGVATVTVSAVANTTTTVGSNPAALTATVAAGGTGAPTPTGSVSFSINGTTVGVATLQADGTASLAHELGKGTTTITATYSGDSGDRTSTGTVTVTAPQITATLTSKHAKTRFGWYRSPVTVNFKCHQGSAALTGPCPGKTTISKQGKKDSLHKSIVATDGGRTSVTVKVKIDTAKPTVKVTGVKKGKTYTHAPSLTCVANDSLSGRASCTIKKHHHGNTVHYVATARDKAGNVAKTKGNYLLV